MNELNFRVATEEDAPQVHQLVESAYSAKDSRKDWTDDLGLLSNFSLDIQEILDVITKPDSAMLMATNNQNILVGSIGTSKRDTNHARIFTFAVDPSQVCRGIGRQVLAYAEEYCQRTWGVTTAGLNALSRRPQILSWYSRQGYKETDRYNRDGQPSHNPYIIFDHVDERSFQKCFEDSMEKLRTRSWMTYKFISHIIVLKLPTRMHEAAHGAFRDIFAIWYRSQKGRLLHRGRADVEGFTRKKCPDYSWMSSVHTPKGDIKWPTIILQAGWSDSSAKLKQDVSFWLRESKEQVKVALTIKVTPKEKITIERWTLKQTVGGNFVEPIQTMCITRQRDTSSNPYQISGSMHIQFEDCFLRAKGENETDSLVSHDDMAEIAGVVWDSVEP
ncbi:unnamed protein product [Penicillium glandicola]